MSRIVAIVGRPNVGKSRLFNRLTRSRISIVHDQPGVTRDVVSAQVKDGGYTLLDTGGLGLKGGDSPAELTAASERQVDFAMQSSDIILFVIDGLAPVTSLDAKIATMLRRDKRNVILVLNKADFNDDKIDLGEVYRLGFGEPIRFSAEHGRGEADLRQLIAKRLGELESPVASQAVATYAAGENPNSGEPFEDDEDTSGDVDDGEADRDTRSTAMGGGKGPTPEKPLCVCFIGRPNVGKSSLSNRLLGSDRLIVSDVPGTTRDAVEIPFVFLGRNRKEYPFRLIDTAGIKAQTRSEIVENAAFPVSVGKNWPRIPRIRANVQAVYAVNDAITATVAGRWSGRMYNTLDNIDSNPNVYGGVSSAKSLDMRLAWQGMNGMEVAVGVDNLTNEPSYQAHPMQGRTVFAELRWTGGEK